MRRARLYVCVVRDIASKPMTHIDATSEHRRAVARGDVARVREASAAEYELAAAQRAAQRSREKRRSVQKRASLFDT